MSTSQELGYLSAARYGKQLVKVARVVREGDQHFIVEYVIRALLEGDIETSYTEADNSVVVATDSIKNTCNIFAKTSPHVLNAPVFALHLGIHFVTKYAHITKSFIDIEQLKWSRIEVNGKPHKWSFVRDGDEKSLVECVVDASAGKESIKGELKVGMKDLLVLKTSGSAFENFVRDEYTTLGEVSDRIFSTSVSIQSSISLPPNIPLTIDNLGEIAKELNFPKLTGQITKDVLETFAEDESASVQATMYITMQNILKSCPAVKETSMQLPNKHYIPINLSAFNLDNGLGKDGGAEVFHPTADPSGYITATVTRK
ncbi:urate oxidase [Kwoniella bestiolae CBS 10118]|uniref:Uricase n=1 Tax=Kwoniella bestiolae CBS 10118 TaxID=1296100 RepID=A0A1B9FW78_9TREE|nr:urate oxidase [Kwoniella bestiolae CBS 10118]OCF23032.1 urate oxidase [Kwoniella bestiolae CBS 10118]